MSLWYPSPLFYKVHCNTEQTKRIHNNTNKSMMFLSENDKAPFFNKVFGISLFYILYLCGQIQVRSPKLVVTVGR